MQMPRLTSSTPTSVSMEQRSRILVDYASCGSAGIINSFCPAPSLRGIMAVQQRCEATRRGIRVYEMITLVFLANWPVYVSHPGLNLDLTQGTPRLTMQQSSPTYNGQRKSTPNILLVCNMIVPKSQQHLRRFRMISSQTGRISLGPQIWLPTSRLSKTTSRSSYRLSFPKTRHIDEVLVCLPRLEISMSNAGTWGNYWPRHV